MLSALFMVRVTRLNLWLTKNVLVISIRLNPWIDIQNNILSQSCMNDIRRCVMNIKMPHLWKRRMFTMLPFVASGNPLGFLMKMDFKS